MSKLLFFFLLFAWVYYWLVKNTEALRRWLVEVMKSNGLTQAEFARKTALTATAVSEIRRGITIDLKDTTVSALCNFAGISQSDFLAISQGSAPGTVRDGRPEWKGSDIESDLAMWLRESATPDAREMVLIAARLAGFRRAPEGNASPATEQRQHSA
jgi:transcriptional regulator with XRE-family HTH domain